MAEPHASAVAAVLPHWTCDRCTFSNEGGGSACELCSTSRITSARGSQEANQSGRRDRSDAAGAARVIALPHLRPQSIAGRRLSASSITSDERPLAEWFEVVGNVVLVILCSLTGLMFGLLAQSFWCSDHAGGHALSLCGFIIGALSGAKVARGRARKSRELDLEGNQWLNSETLHGLGVSLPEPRREERRRVVPAPDSVIEALPAHTLSADDISSASMGHQSCSICIQDFELDEEQRTLPCSHRFHKGCIDEWLRRKGACPLCLQCVDESACMEVKVVISDWV